MKAYFIAILVTFGYIQNASSMTLVEPISFALTRTLTESEMPSESKCPDNHRAIENLKMEAGQLRHNKLVPLITEKLPNPYAIDGIEDLIATHCNSNGELNKLANGVTENVKHCSGGNIDGGKLEKLHTDIIGNVCGGTSGLVTWGVMNAKIARDNQG